MGIGSRAPLSVSGKRPSSDDDGARADPLQRFKHPPHRASTQRGIAIEHGGDRAACYCPQHEPTAGPGIAEIERALGRRKTCDADAAHTPFTRAKPLDTGAERRHRFASVEDVLTFEQSANPGLTDRQCAENERPMRDRFVARHAHAASQWTIPAGG